MISNDLVETLADPHGSKTTAGLYLVKQDKPVNMTKGTRPIHVDADFSPEVKGFAGNPLDREMNRL